MEPQPTAPPAAARRPHVVRAHGDERADDWYWLRDRDDPAVRAYLEAENAYLEVATEHLTPLRDRIFDEIRTRVQETDVSAPVRWDAWEYYVRTIEDEQYAVRCRRPAGDDALPDALAAPASMPGEEILLDENALAKGHEYFSLGAFSVSPDQRVLAYAVDTEGGERHVLRFRDLAHGTDLGDEIPDVYYGLAWSDDARTIFYVRPDQAMRPFEVWRHELGTSVDDDVRVLHEPDEHFFVTISRTRSGRYVLLSSNSKTTSETWYVPSDSPAAEPRPVMARRAGVEYHVEHHVSDALGDRFYVLTNEGAENFRLVTTPVGSQDWEDVIPHRADVRLEDVDAFADHLVVSERAEAHERLRVVRLHDGDDHLIALPDPVGSMHLGPTPEYETHRVRVEWSSLVTPPSSYDYDLDDRTMTLRKRQPVLGGYDPDRYESTRTWATAPDGARVPISVVHRRGLRRDGSAPCLLYGYGSYEISIDPTFSTSRLSLLERGFVYAIAHVRGGGEMGRPWYDDGKLLAKRNTFADFVACAEHLVAEGYTTSARLAARGGSAGGLLMGAVANLRPELFTAIVAEVPFVDCLTTILDPSLPLTITEWEEWGDPLHDPEVYEYIKGYSPYDNVRAVEYPALFVTAGINDPRVQYWEPAKWVAKLRATRTGDRLLVLKTEMGAGHHGASGRYDAWRDEALVLAFVIDQVGVAGT